GASVSGLDPRSVRGRGGPGRFCNVDTATQRGTMTHEHTLALLRERFGDDSFTTSEFRDNRRVIVPPARLYAVLECLKQQCAFDMLIDVTAADYLYYPDARDRFGVIYALLNTSTGERLYVKTLLNEPDLTIPSAFPLWKGADWMEREVYDMYGIVFEG